MHAHASTPHARRTVVYVERVGVGVKERGGKQGRRERERGITRKSEGKWRRV